MENQDFEFMEQQLELEQAMQTHGYNNKIAISESNKCICSACSTWYVPSQIISWYENKHAICPNKECGLTGVIIGSSSGLDLKLFESANGSA